MKKAKNMRSARSSFRLAIFSPLITLGVMTIVSIGLIVGYSLSNNSALLIVLLSLLIALGLAFTIFCFILFRWIYNVYYRGLYQTTVSNLTNLSKDNADLGAYPDVAIEEIEALNLATDQIKTKFDNAYLIAYRPDYSHIDLEYIDKNKSLISFESFRKNIDNIIFVSQSFRNVVIEVHYPTLEKELEKEEINRLIDLYDELFKDYDNHLLMVGNDNKSIFIYLPVIDSFGRINEILNIALKNSSVTERNTEGLTNIAAKFAVVAYPYSSVDSIFSDLRYAKRQNKTINFFLPNRVKNNVDEKVLMHTSMNINYMSRIIENLSYLNAKDKEASAEIMSSLFNNLSKYLSIDEAGIISYDSTTRRYISSINVEDSAHFKKNKIIDNKFIETISEATDSDNSLYFSKRSHVSTLAGRQFDYYGINSGYYYSIKRGNQIIGLIYFFNYDKEMVLDSYIRETLFMLSIRIANYFEAIEMEDELDLIKDESGYLLSIGKYSMYKIDDDFNLTYLSSQLKSLFPKIKEDSLCYNAFYGLDKPCNDCPVKSFKKKESIIKNNKYLISLTLNDRKTHNRSLLVEKIVSKNEYEPDIFNKDLLTYSFSTLVNTIQDAYYSKSRGYLLLLCLDNYESFVESQGSEGALFAIRCLAHKLKDKLKTSEVYVYNPSTLAIVFPLIGHADVIDKCELIYEISKEHYLDDGSDDSFKITYLPLAYPRGYATAEDFMRHVSNFYASEDCVRNKDFIYFFDHSISRSASKREFMINVIEEEFSGKMTTSVNLQPMVQAKDRKIYGAEILLRINDVHRNVFFSAEAISRIAEQEDKTYLITESIIKYVGQLYQEYGDNTFKINNFKRVAINIDQTYLRNPELIKTIININNENHLPSNFVSFEIPEDMIPDNIDKIRRFANELSSIHIMFSCDRYSGRYVGVEKLKELGFKEIKIMKSIIDGIDKDPQRFNEVKAIVENAKKVGLSTAVVGVENEAQYKLLKDLDQDMMLQGYYFYKPLSKSDLIASLISYN